MGASSRRITFVHAPEDYYDQNYGTQFVPLWAYCLAAHVPASWEVSIVDCKHQDARWCEVSDVFAFSGINQDVTRIKEIWKVLKRRHPHATFILGGPITWSFEQDGKLSQLDDFDHVFILDGEETLPGFLTDLEQGRGIPHVIRGERFALSASRKIAFDLFKPACRHYYGGVVEVSRGCPFLCEFCDIRVLPGNNQSNNKPPALIIAELDEYYRLGIRHIQFACDNFIGDIVWARAVLDAMIEWKQRVNADISVFTWLTINLYRYPDVMAMMRRAGFSILFIGIESVNQHSLLETAKVQNVVALEQAVTTIQSYGFIIAPGFIFGFDSDTETVFDDTLRFLEASGIIGGDPSFLMALPGTPLFERMERSGRLVRSDDGVARQKIQTNICYLQDSRFLVGGFIRFIEKFTGASFQYARLKRLLEIIRSSGNYIPLTGPGYGSPLPYLRLQLRVRRYSKMLWRRIRFLSANPRNLWTLVKGRWLVQRELRNHPGLAAHFFYWVYAWTNIALKYEGLNDSHFALHSIDSRFDMSKLAPVDPTVDQLKRQVADGIKVVAQARFTNRALERLMRERLGEAARKG